jgi:hypothetical protein
LDWVVRASFGEVLNVVHFEDCFAGIGDIIWLPSARRVFAVTAAALHDRISRGLDAQVSIDGDLCAGAVRGSQPSLD